MVASITIYTDGAARGNPGPSASGYSIYKGREPLNRECKYNGKMTNNSAEYTAIIMALSWCGDNLITSENLQIELYSDSELVIRQLKGRYKVKSKDMKRLHDEVLELVEEFDSVSFDNLPRSNPNISKVDKMLNELLDTEEEKTSAKE